jgi:hypothetical protein
MTILNLVLNTLYKNMDWTYLAQNRLQLVFFREYGSETVSLIKDGEFHN